MCCVGAPRAGRRVRVDARAVRRAGRTPGCSTGRRRRRTHPDLQKLGVDVVRLDAAAWISSRNPFPPIRMTGRTRRTRGICTTRSCSGCTQSAHRRAHLALGYAVVGERGIRSSTTAPTDSRRSPRSRSASAARFPWITRWTVWNEPNVRHFLIRTLPRCTSRVSSTRLTGR